MKRILFFVAFALTVVCGTLIAQENSVVASAFQKSNATVLSGQLSDEVAFISGSTNDTFSKSEFVAQLNRFLRANVATEFEVIHEGARGDSRFMICALTSAKGSYRIHIFFKKINNQYLINQVRIENSNE
ncbi:MAG: DUF4783 domain-containing protein [Bacteroidales bacterium]